MTSSGALSEILERIRRREDPRQLHPLSPLSSLPESAHLIRIVEALLFAAAGPLSASELASALPEGSDVMAVLAEIQQAYAGRGVNLVRLGGGWMFRTAPDLAADLRGERIVSRKLSRAAVETLAIVAYHQPVTRAEIEEIRGVSVSGGTLDQLIELGWVRLGRRKLRPGRPMTFVVTQAFLDHFGLESDGDLPGIAELRAAGLLDNRPGPEAPPTQDSDDETLADQPLGQDELFD